MKNSALYYSVGALLYCPANKKHLAHSIINEKFDTPFSLALCLEDTINDQFVKEAELQLVHSLFEIYEASLTTSFFIPKIFIRVRHTEQILNIFRALGKASVLLTGFILPKFSLKNADAYLTAMQQVNLEASRPIYLMPILENSDMIYLQKRYDILYTIKDKLDMLKELVLNIRVGGNDLSHMFGFRRHSNESIHSLKPVSHIFSDIITVFGMDYVVSGPVWEYYDGENWKEGLQNELREDRLCGFIGKTVIHPKQISVVNDAYRISSKDFCDAKAILNWDTSAASLVSGSSGKERMNEYKTHSNWAVRTLFLAEAYGVR